MLLNRLVIGSTVESVLYAFINDCYYLPNTNTGPLFFEKLDFPFLGKDRKEYTWSRLLTFIGLSGKLLSYENVQTLKVEENFVKISTSSGLFKYNFNLCEIFDTTNIILENKIINHNQSKYYVYDDFEISRLGGKRKYIDAKISNDVLASKIYFYTSDRVDGANYVTDCVSESILSLEQINDVNFSDSIVRFAISRYLNSVGIYGNFMKFYKNGKPKFRKPNIIHRKRIVIKKDKNEYEDSEKIKFINPILKDIIHDYSTSRS